jgi:hypothetical protein
MATSETSDGFSVGHVGGGAVVFRCLGVVLVIGSVNLENGFRSSGVLA